MAVQRPVAERWERMTARRSPKATACRRPRRSPPPTGSTAPEFTGTIGLPLPSTDVAIRDEDGNTCRSAKSAKSASRPAGDGRLLEPPDETAKVMTPDGYFRSGDMGFMDERGYTKIVDRKKDMILVSGFNVYPNEIEEVAMHPGMLEARQSACRTSIPAKRPRRP
jgi:long-chain acyl-CoA synthetase